MLRRVFQISFYAIFCHFRHMTVFTSLTRSRYKNIYHRELLKPKLNFQKPVIKLLLSEIFCNLLNSCLGVHFKRTSLSAKTALHTVGSFMSKIFVVFNGKLIPHQRKIVIFIYQTYINVCAARLAVPQ